MKVDYRIHCKEKRVFFAVVSFILIFACTAVITRAAAFSPLLSEAAADRLNDSGDGVLHPDESASEAALFADGVYYIASKLNINMRLDVTRGGTSNGTNLWLFENNGSTGQQFRITGQSDGKTYRLQAVYNDFYIDNGGSSDVGFNTRMRERANTGNQLWYITDAGNGWYTIVNHDSGLVLDVQNGKAANGTNIQQHISNGTDAQKFRFIPAGDADISDGVYTIESKLNTDFRLEAAGAGTGNGTNLWLNQKKQTTAQQFRVTRQSDGKTYRLQAVCNDLYIDNGGSFDVDFNTHMWERASTDNQIWNIIDTGDGWYSIINQRSWLALDVEKEDVSGGTNIRQHTYYGGDAQKWRFVHVHTLTRVASQAATTNSEGNTEYWKCNSCGELFADAEAENRISYSQTVIPKLPVRKNTNSTYVKKLIFIIQKLLSDIEKLDLTQIDVQDSDGDVSSLYRIRKSWTDTESQKGAYEILDKAKKCADQNPGYKVFDADGRVVYEPKAAELAARVPFMVETGNPELIIRTGPGSGYDRVQFCPPGLYMIMEVKEGQGSELGWGRLKSGMGWIPLDNL